MGAGAGCALSAVVEHSDAKDLGNVLQALPSKCQERLARALAEFETTQAIEECSTRASHLPARDFDTLEGTWEYGGSRYRLRRDAGTWFFNEDMFEGEGSIEGDWLVIPLYKNQGCIRIKPGTSGVVAMSQFKGAGSLAEWEEPMFAAKQGSIVDGAKLLTIDVTNILSPDGDMIGHAARDVLLVASGELDRSGSYPMVPVRPFGKVNFCNVKLQESDDDASRVGIMNPVAAGKAPRKYSSLASIRDALKGGDTVLVRGTWLRKLSMEAGVLPRRQELPPEAIWDYAELLKLVAERKVQLVALSYCWLSPGHPDPHGHQLQTVGRIIGQRLDEITMPLDDLAFFIDWCSLYQRPRTAQEDAAFGRGLGAVNVWYAHEETMVWLLTKVPSGVVPYNLRGWPTFEKALSGMLTDSVKLLDIGQCDDNCAVWFTSSEVARIVRTPPLVPTAFAAELSAKTFTNNADHGFVEKKYADTFSEVMGSAQHLLFAGLRWSPDQICRVAEALAYSPELVVLTLDRNNVGRAGALALAKSLPTCTKLKVIILNSTSLDDESVIALAPVLSCSPVLEAIELTDNEIGPAGITALARGIRHCTSLGSLYIGENPIGDEGAFALAEVIPFCTSMRYLDLQDAGLGQAAQKTLREAWVMDARAPSHAGLLL